MDDQISSYWQLLEPEFERININEGPEKYAAACQSVWRPIVLLCATHMCTSEVHNGGFLQLFWNSTGITVPEAIEGISHNRWFLHIPETQRGCPTSRRLAGSR